MTTLKTAKDAVRAMDEAGMLPPTSTNIAAYEYEKETAKEACIAHVRSLPEQGEAVEWQYRLPDSHCWYRCGAAEYEARKLACPHLLRAKGTEFRALFAAPVVSEDARAAARYRWLRGWFLREGKRSEIDPSGHIRQANAAQIDAAINAAMLPQPPAMQGKGDA